jgi:hypothetical protein
MPERKHVSLKEVLASFDKALTKTAEEGIVADPAAVCPDCGQPSDQCVCEEGAHAEDLAAAAQALEEASANAAVANEEVVEAKDALKSVADEFINEHTAALKKEAQVFGELFAASVLEQMNKTAALEDHAAQSYGFVMNAMQKQASIYEEAYKNTLAKLAGFEDAEDMEAAAGQQLSPEEMLALMQANQEEEPAEVPEGVADQEVSDEELAQLAAVLAANEDAEDAPAPEEIAEAAAEDGASPEAVAQAANLLAEAREAEGDEKVAAEIVSNAYEQVMAALGKQQG